MANKIKALTIMRIDPWAISLAKRSRIKKLAPSMKKNTLAGRKNFRGLNKTMVLKMSMVKLSKARTFLIFERPVRDKYSMGT
jgi:hypothetical protein